MLTKRKRFLGSLAALLALVSGLAAPASTLAAPKVPAPTGDVTIQAASCNTAFSGFIGGGQFYVEITNLQLSANQYDEFKAELNVNGGYVDEIHWTSDRTQNSTDFQPYNWNWDYWNYPEGPAGYYSRCYAKYNGVWYSAGQG